MWRVLTGLNSVLEEFGGTYVALCTSNLWQFWMWNMRSPPFRYSITKKRFSWTQKCREVRTQSGRRLYIEMGDMRAPRKVVWMQLDTKTIFWPKSPEDHVYRGGTSTPGWRFIVQYHKNYSGTAKGRWQRA